MAWIRSQDKEYLINVQGIAIEGPPSCTDFTDFKLIMWSPGDYYPAGTFPTQKAALEELNRIHNWIALQNAQGVYQVSQEDK